MLFASTLELACVGIDIVNKALAFRKGVPKPAYEKDREFEDLLMASEKSIKYVISVNADLVIEKIEQDKLEELSSRIKNIGMLIKLDRTDELMSYKLLNSSIKILMSLKRDIPWDLYYEVLNNSPGSVPNLIKKIKECSLKDSCASEIESNFGTPDIEPEKVGGIKGDSKIDEKDGVMFCRKCGGKLMPNAHFCRRCGSKAI